MRTWRPLATSWWPIVAARASAHLPARALTSDLTGRVFESSGRSGTNATRIRHGAASDYNPHTVEIERFVDRIARQLGLHAAGELSALVLIAEPRLLGVLRARLPKELHKLVTHEISGTIAWPRGQAAFGPHRGQRAA